jgi:hypothetical protein
MVILISMLQLPATQHILIDKANAFLSEKLKFEITVEGIYIDWFDEIALVGVKCIDPYGGEMVYLDEAEVDYTIISLLGGKFNIDNIELTNGEVNVVRYVGSSDLNFAQLIWNIQDLTTPSVPDPNHVPKPFDIGRFTVNNMKFSYDDKREPFIGEEMFDHNHFTLDSIFGLISKFRSIHDTVELRARHLQVKLVESHLRLHELSTDFRLTKKSIECDKLYARIGETYIGDYLRFSYDSVSYLSEFNDKVDIFVRLKNSSVFVKDVAHFAPALLDYQDIWKLNGVVSGRVNDLLVDSLDARFGKNAHVAGKLKFIGLPEISETNMDLNLSDINVFSYDLEQYTGPISDRFLYKFGRIEGSGALVGMTDNFSARGKFNTGLGYLESDVDFILNQQNKNASTFKGYVVTKDFEIGNLLGYPIFGLMDMKGNIDGKGLSVDESDIKLDATFSRLGLNGYDYKNISTNAELKDKFFDGVLSVADTNFKLQAEGKIDLAVEGKERFDILGDLHYWNLKETGFSAVPSTFATKFDMDFTGTDLDKIMGDATLVSSDLQIDQKNLSLKFAQLLVARNEQLRYVRLNSDFISGSLSGPFELSHLVFDLPRLFNEYALFVSNEKKYVDDYYKKRGTIASKKYKLDYNFNIKKLNPILDMFAPGVYLSDNSKLEGSFSSGYTSILNAFATFDTLVYKGHEIRKGQFDLSASKLTDSASVLASFIVSSQSQQFQSFVPTENLLIEGVWDKNRINFSSGIKQRNDKNNLHVEGELLLKENGKLLRLSNSYASVLGKKWKVKDSNEVYFNAHTIDFNKCGIQFDAQSVDLSGSISNNESKKALLRVNKFNLDNLNPLLDYQLSGIVNANVTLRDVYNSLDLDGKVRVDSLVVDKFYIGDIHGRTDWINDNKSLDVILDVKRENNVIINTFGKIFPGTEKKKTDMLLIANLKNADISILSPILSGVMSDLKGDATGKLTVRGSLSDIKVKGEVKVTNGKFKVDYLGTRYRLDDVIHFDEGIIGFRKMKVKDVNGSEGVLNGGIYHDGFTNFVVDISSNFSNFQVLNTTEKDNDMFYGEAYTSGNVTLFGPFEHLVISATMKSEKNTKIYIPIGSTGDVTQSDFITFKSRNEKKLKKDSVQQSAVEVNLNLEITQDAYSEIIFDKQAGDIIKARGEGTLDMRVDTRGDFTMNGILAIKSGKYNFTMAGLINKEFNIKEGILKWDGDPFAGIVDVKAIYAVPASLKPLIEDTTLLNNSELQKKYLTHVLLGVRGEMLHPEITLGCSIAAPLPQNPTIYSLIFNYMNTLKTNDQELNKQVFSLIMLKRFSAPNSFSGGGIGGGATLSELFSNQLSNILSQVDENLEVNVNLRNVDRDALNSMQLRFSYTALDGRLRISREGSFQNVQNSQQANISNIAGEWTVEYLISEDGRLRLKLFNKIQNNGIVTSMNNATNTSAGFSMMHTQSFDTFSDLIGGKRKRKQKEKEKKENSIIININSEDEEEKGNEKTEETPK